MFNLGQEVQPPTPLEAVEGVNQTVHGFVG